MGKKREKKMDQRGEKASLTVEAALVFPILFAVVFLLVRVTIWEYKDVQERSSMLIQDTTGSGAEISTTQIIRITDTAFRVIE